MSAEEKPVARPTGRPAHGPGGGMAGMPVEKAQNFRASIRRVTQLLTPEAPVVATVLVIGAVSVALAVIGPKILGEATTTIFTGFLTGEGIDFGRLHRILIGVAVIYIFSSLLSYLQGYILNGVTQRTIYRLRQSVETKINALPLNYFDRHQRGDLLSRVTNDIDNVSQTLQQTLSQLFNSVLTVVGVLIMMLIIDWQLAMVAIVSIPLTIGIVTMVAKRSQPKFIAQWKHTGTLNAQIEEGYTGHALVKVFGRQREVEATFAQKND
jgi:ATP-binding cassette subfamily B multidrug efflux pump